MFNFEKLDVWQKSISFAGLIYEKTRLFPAEERFGLTNQMHRAAVSISSNIAEGCSRASSPDFRRFGEIAVGSAFEVVSQTRIARSEGWLSDEDHTQIYTAALEIVRMLSGLRSSLKD